MTISVKWSEKTKKEPKPIGEWIGDYYVREPLSNKNAGFSLWGFGEKEGKRYFLKQYLSPVFPSKEGGLSEKVYEKKLASSIAFQKNKHKLFTIINESSDGNLLKIHEFFRYGSKYYISAEAVDTVPPEEVAKLSEDEKLLILLGLSHSMKCFHENGLVHGDMKPDNILYRRSKKGYITPIIIDIDNCFYLADPPKDGDSINVDQVYMAPETFRFIREEKVKLSEKIDIFALGLIFYEILCGTLPVKNEREYPFSVLLDGGRLDTSAVRNAELAYIIDKMLVLDPEKRISMRQVHEHLLRLSGRKLNDNTDHSEDNSFFKRAGDL